MRINLPKKPTILLSATNWFSKRRFGQILLPGICCLLASG